MSMDIKEAIDGQKAFKNGFLGMTYDICDFTIAALEELQQYRQIGTVDECRVAREKQIPKEPKRVHIKHGKHKWRRNKNGEIDDFAWGFEFHNGVTCEVCGRNVCVHCNPDYDELDDCEEKYFQCPNCGEHYEVGYDRQDYCPKCGQHIQHEDWESD